MEPGERQKDVPHPLGTGRFISVRGNARTLDFQKKQEIQIPMWNLETFKSWKPMLKLTFHFEKL